tara:strand:+ start:1932 stop:2372 length:441 start_codon:yes stop_codon:yes gene_type:complete
MKPTVLKKDISMKKILEFFGTKVFKQVGDVVDDLFTSEEERLNARNKIFKVLQDAQLEFQRMQTDIILAEAKGNWLQRSWRPILMLSFGFIIIYTKFISQLSTSLITPVLEPEFWELLEIGIGGYVIGRSGEKIVDKLGPLFNKNK